MSPDTSTNAHTAELNAEIEGQDRRVVHDSMSGFAALGERTGRALALQDARCFAIVSDTRTNDAMYLVEVTRLRYP